MTTAAAAHHYATIDPYTGELKKEFDALDPAGIDRAGAIADEAFAAWRSRPIAERAAEQLMNQVRDAVEKGASVVIGGDRPDLPGAFVEPTILAGVQPNMRAYREELFGLGGGRVPGRRRR